MNREYYYCSRILLTKNAQKTKQKKRFFYEFLFINQERESGNFRKLKITKNKIKNRNSIHTRERKYFDLDDQPMVEIDFFFWRFPKNHSNPNSSNSVDQKSFQFVLNNNEFLNYLFENVLNIFVVNNVNVDQQFVN